MLDTVKIEGVARAVARRHITQHGLERVLTELAVDSDGKDALRITLVISPQAAEHMTGDQTLAVLTELQRELGEKGEERFPIVQYATEAELDQDELLDEPASDEDDI